MRAEELEQFKTYQIEVEFASKALILEFKETQDNTLQSLFDKLESGKFHEFNLSSGLGTIRVNTDKIIAYGVRNE